MGAGGLSPLTLTTPRAYPSVDNSSHFGGHFLFTPIIKTTAVSVVTEAGRTLNATQNSWRP